MNWKQCLLFLAWIALWLWVLSWGGWQFIENVPPEL